MSSNRGIIKVSKFTITDYSPRLDAAERKKWGHLLPDRFHCEHAEFDISGVSNAISNGIRRTICCELPVRALDMLYESVETDDVFILPELIIRRLRAIPILQSIDPRSKFELNVTNTTATVMDVKTRDFRQSKPARGGPLPFNGGTTICSIRPGHSFRIKKAIVITNFGYETNYGMMTLVCNATSIAKNLEFADAFERSGVSVGVSDASEWRIAFTTNGTISPQNVIRAACKNIISRVNSVRKLIDNIDSNNGEYALTVEGETDTIGNLFMRTISDLYPEIRAVVYTTSNVDRSMTIRIKCDEDIRDVLESAIVHIIDVYEKILDGIVDK